MKGTVVDFQHLCVNDGPGIRTIVFLKGCPLSCAWCHNPEMIKAEPEISFSQSVCIQCGKCISVCPEKCHLQKEQVHIFERETCRMCAECVRACPAALEIKGRIMTAKEVLVDLLADRVFYESSGGGITVSGGEPLMQPAFTEEILRLSKSEGLHTAIESSLFASFEKIEAIIPFADLFLCDWKLTDDSLHRKWCGASNKQIRNNLIRLSERGAHIHLRCPVIPGINDNKEHFSGIAELADKLSGIKRVELMPYHNIWKTKARTFGIESCENFEVPTKEQVDEWLTALRKMTKKEVILG